MDIVTIHNLHKTFGKGESKGLSVNDSPLLRAIYRCGLYIIINQFYFYVTTCMLLEAYHTVS